MKIHYLLVFHITVVSLLLLIGCKDDIHNDEYLRRVLGNLEEIKSASYLSYITMTLPGDTITLNTYSYYKKEFVNPADTIIGSTFAWFEANDTSKMYLCYDGNASINMYKDTKTTIIDSFKVSDLPFRRVSEPFFKLAKSLVKYTLQTHDSISTDLTDFGDSVRIRIKIPEKIITFHGGPYIYVDPTLTKDENYSRYEMWINRSDNLPFKIGFKFPSQYAYEECKDVQLNKEKLEDFIPSKYFPSDFIIKERVRNQPAIRNLIGMKAPDWTLIDSDKNSVALSNLKSQVLIIEFTGIGCVPCHSAVPFLKQLVNDYQTKDFELVSIETWSQSNEVFKSYKDNNELNYKFLLSTKEVIKNYNAGSVPLFFILDNKRVIRKIITGYSKGTTDKEIKEAINELI
jgi:peroxiredoxin